MHLSRKIIYQTSILGFLVVFFSGGVSNEGDGIDQVTQFDYLLFLIHSADFIMHVSLVNKKFEIFIVSLI